MILLGIILAIIGAFVSRALLIVGVVLIVIGLLIWLVGGYPVY